MVSVYYYQADGNDDILIYGKDINPKGGIITLPRLFLSYYSIIAAIFAIICGVIMILSHRKKKVFNFTVKLIFLPVSYLLGHLIIKGFTLSSYNATREFYAILLLMFPMYIVSLTAVNLIKKYKNKV